MFKLCFQYTGISGVATVSSLAASVTSTPCVQVCHNDVMEVVLNCWARGGYGLILQRNPALSDNSNRAPLCVSYIEKGSPADKCGILHVGDRVLVINDWCTAGGTPEEANYIVRHATGPLTLTIEFDVLDAALPSNGVFTIKLAKKGQNLGISLANAAASQKGDPVVVSDVRTGSVAHRCGAIQIGDQLLAIDSIPLDTCTVEEASRLLQRSPDTVKLRIKKNPLVNGDVDPAETLSALTGHQTIVYTLELNRKSGGPLGLTIAGTDDRFDPIFVSQIAAGGLAEKTGAVRVGDRILAINGHWLQGKRVSEALHILNQSTDSVSLKIARTISEHSINTNTTRLPPVQGPSSMIVGHHERTHVYHEHFNERATTDKLGTPVQSIDSAVESLEDGPLLAESQQVSNTSTAQSNRNSQTSKSSSVSGAAHSDVGVYDLSAEELSSQLQRTFKSNGGQGSRQSDAGSSSMATDDEQHYAETSAAASCPCPSHSNTTQTHDEWVRVLEALESVGEAEMLKKVEENVGPAAASASGSNGTLVSPSPESTLPKPYPTSSSGSSGGGGGLLKAAFPASASSTSRLVSTSYLSMSAETTRPVTTVANADRSSLLLLGTSTAPSAICSVPRPLSISTILSGYEHIPLISTPVPSRAPSHPPPPDLTSPAPNRIMFPAAPGSGPNETSHVPLEIYRVQLDKDKVYNDFGFSVSDGLQEKGVYINKIRTGGPADLSGSIRPLDRILQVNGSSLIELDCMLAVPMLAAAGDHIDLMICRDPVLAATFNRMTTTDSIEEEDEDETLSLVGQTTV